MSRTIPKSRLRRVAFMLALAIATSASLRPASAGFFDFLFGTPDHAATQQADTVTAPTSERAADPLPPLGGHARTTGHCVRLCDGKHFPVSGRGEMSPVAMCQAFCPASITKVFFGGRIERAISMDGERYSELDTAFAYRNKLSSNCTCNGREPAGLAPVDISLDTTLRPGDIVATSTGLVAFSGPRYGGMLSDDFTPVASYTGLSAAARAQLAGIKVAPVHADMSEERTASIDAARAMRDARPRASLN